jgi:RimJ/RimL family protein N-acetyltransferase
VERLMFFETKDLIADRLTAQDSKEFHRICNQAFILKWMDDWKMDFEQINRLIDHFITGYSVRNPKHTPFIMAVRTKTRKLIGICGFGPKEELGGEAEIAYFIDENYAGKGYMGQIVGNAIEFYFIMTGKPYICALVDDNNIPSKRILIKNGFTYYKVHDSNNILKSHYRLYRTK